MSKEQDYIEYIEKKTNSVLEVELNARFQKAQYDTMYYTIESDKLSEEYFALVVKQNAEKKQNPKP